MIGLALKNIKGNPVRSLIIFLCILGVAGLFVSITLIVRGADNSLHAGLDRLGADIVVVPEGAESKVETALLMGKPTDIWMSADYAQKIAAVPGIDSVSPQIYLQSLYGASCCAVSEMFLLVFDPATDFTITPWLQRNLGRGLAKGEVIGGRYIFVPPGEKDIRLYGYHLTLRGNLEPTGTGLDQTMFFTLETALDMANSSLTTAESPLVIPPNKISALMVKVTPEADAHAVSLQILRDVLGVFPIESPNLFGAFRHQMLGLLWVFLIVLILVWVLSTLLIGLIFSIVVNERQQEIAVLRALGATRWFVFRSVLFEAALLAFAAAGIGVSLAAFTIYILRDSITNSLEMPFLFPSFSYIMALLVVVIALSLITVTVAVFLPAFMISKGEPAVAMRE